MTHINVNASPGQQPYVPEHGPDAVTPGRQVETSKEALYAQYVSSYVPQSFSKGHVDDAKAEEPILPTPLEGNQKRSGVEPAVQDIVRGIIAKEIITMLPQTNAPGESEALFAHLMQGAELKNKKLQELANQLRPQIEAKIQKEGRLENFTLEALYIQNEKAWIQTPLAPMNKEMKGEVYAFYDQSLEKNLNVFLSKIQSQDPVQQEEYVHRLTLAVNGGHVHPSVKAALNEIKNLSIEETRHKFGLPISWKPGTTETDNWRPVNVGLTSLDAVGAARKERLNQNIGDFLKLLTQAGEALIKKMPAEDPNRKEVENFLSTIMNAIFEYQRKLQEYQLVLAQQSEEHALNILSTQEARNATNETKIEEAREMQQKQNVMEAFSFAMKIIGPAIAIISMALMVASFGLASPIAMAGLAVGAAMLAYSVLDSTVGVTSKIIEGMNELVDKLPTNDLGKALAKVVIVIGAIAVIALLAAAVVSGTGASAAANVATQTIATALRQAAAMAAKQIAIQASLILLMGSGVLMEVPSEALKLTGWNDTTINALKYAIIFVEMMAVLAVSIKLSSSAMKIESTTQQAAQTSMTTTEKISAAAKNASQQVKETFEGIAQSLAEFKDAFIFRVKNLKSIPTDSKDWLINMLKASVDQFTHTWAHAQQQGENPLKQMAILLLGRLGTVLPPLSNAIASGFMAYNHYQLYTILKEAADTEEMLAEIQAMLDLLNDVVKNLQSAMQMVPEDIEDAAKVIENILNSLTKTSRSLAQSAPVLG